MEALKKTLKSRTASLRTQVEAKEAGVSDSQLYKQAGNSVTVNVTEMIGRAIACSNKSEVDNAKQAAPEVIDEEDTNK